MPNATSSSLNLLLIIKMFDAQAELAAHMLYDLHTHTHTHTRARAHEAYDVTGPGRAVVLDSMTTHCET